MKLLNDLVELNPPKKLGFSDEASLVKFKIILPITNDIQKSPLVQL